MLAVTESTMSIEATGPAIIATVGGSALVIAMFGKLVAEAVTGYLALTHDRVDRLELTVDGRDFSVDLKTIGNGGSEKIEEALAALKRG